MVVTCYPSRTRDDTPNMFYLTGACCVDVFPTGVVDLNSQWLKTTALSAGLCFPSLETTHRYLVCG